MSEENISIDIDALEMYLGKLCLEDGSCIRWAPQIPCDLCPLKSAKNFKNWLERG